MPCLDWNASRIAAVCDAPDLVLRRRPRGVCICRLVAFLLAYGGGSLGIGGLVHYSRSTWAVGPRTK